MNWVRIGSSAVIAVQGPVELKFHSQVPSRETSTQYLHRYCTSKQPKSDCRPRRTHEICSSVPTNAPLGTGDALAASNGREVNLVHLGLLGLTRRDAIVDICAVGRRGSHGFDTSGELVCSSGLHLKSGLSVRNHPHTTNNLTPKSPESSNTVLVQHDSNRDTASVV